MAPAKVMTMLDRLYQAFDALTAQHGLFKARSCNARSCGAARWRLLPLVALAAAC
jgi:hypothetical protein